MEAVKTSIEQHGFNPRILFNAIIIYCVQMNDEMGGACSTNRGDNCIQTVVFQHHVALSLVFKNYYRLNMQQLFIAPLSCIHHYMFRPSMRPSSGGHFLLLVVTLIRWATCRLLCRSPPSTHTVRSPSEGSSTHQKHNNTQNAKTGIRQDTESY
jgi:hypothetical protein